MLYQTQAQRVNTAVEEYNNLDIGKGTEGGFLNEVATLTNDAVDSVTTFLSGLIESLAVMIVTACIIPILVFVFLVWLVKTIFASNVLTLDTSALDALTGKTNK
jgi:hypothetical protein